MTWSRRIPFKVDVGGIIEIMGRSLYSRADTPIREVIQNAHDAIMRRRQRELTFQGRIDIEQDAENHCLRIHDDGVGLSVEEAENYLGTLGVGMTGLIKKGIEQEAVDRGELIGQFGIGLFSAFMISERLVVESRRLQSDQAVRWEAGDGIDMLLSASHRTTSGTTVTMALKQEYRDLAAKPDLLEAAIKGYADFLTVPIFLNRGKARVNVIHAAWFEPTPEREAVELELEGCFGETPLDVLPLRLEKPVALSGALYVTPQRTPGFTSEPVLTVTVRRMVISRRIQGLLPTWAPFLRGVLEIAQCSPTASREDLVRDGRFEAVRVVLEEKIYEHFEALEKNDPARWDSIVLWHRYTLLGAALEHRRLRDLLRRTYKLQTSRGPMTFDEVLAKSPADPLLETYAERVIWHNAERLQEAWMNQVFGDHETPCVHTLRSFEESMLASWVADTEQAGTPTDFRLATPSSPNFAANILGVHDLCDISEPWQQFLAETGATIRTARFRTGQPVLAFLNERQELRRTFEEKKAQMPSAFQRLIERHFEHDSTGRNELLLNVNHRLVRHALEQSTSHPLASVLRLLAFQALSQAGATLSRQVSERQMEDLDWIADALWNRKSG